MSHRLQIKLEVRKSPKPNKSVRLLTSGRSPGKAVTEVAFSAHPHKFLQQDSHTSGSLWSTPWQDKLF